MGVGHFYVSREAVRHRLGRGEGGEGDRRAVHVLVVAVGGEGTRWEVHWDVGTAHEGILDGLWLEGGACGSQWVE